MTELTASDVEGSDSYCLLTLDLVSILKKATRMAKRLSDTTDPNRIAKIQSTLRSANHSLSLLLSHPPPLRSSLSPCAAQTQQEAGKTIYFRIEGRDGDKWYAINPDVSVKLRKVVLDRKLTPMPPDTNKASYAAIGSKIFLTGGIKLVQDMGAPVPLHTGTDQVYYFDTSRPKEGWKEAPRMNSKRMWHYAFADQGKLFVLGGGIARYPPDADGKRVYAEVYDPSDDTASWKELVRVGDGDGFPEQIYGHAVLDHAPSQNKRILYHSHLHGRLFYLDLGSQSVGIHNQSFDMFHISLAFLDGTLYYVHIGTVLGLFAYNVSEPNSRPKPVMLPEGRKLKIMPSSSLEKPIPKAHLVPLGDKTLALIWAENRVDFKVSDTILLLRVYCSKLEVSKVDDCYRAKLLSHSEYTAHAGPLSCCLAV